MVDVDGSSRFSADSQPKSIEGWRPPDTQTTFINQLNRVNSRNDIVVVIIIIIIINTWVGVLHTCLLLL